MSKESLEQKLANWMRGRNGSDELGNSVIALALLLLIINIFAGIPALSLIALALTGYACWRMSSKNIAARRAENRAYLVAIGPAAYWVSNPKETFEEFRNYKHLTCPSCGKTMRVPRGKGNLRVTCPSCGTKFEAKS